MTALGGWGAAVFLAHLASTLLMTGIIWFVQVVHYPLLAGVGAPGFAAYAGRHGRLTSWVVGPPMLVEAGTAALLVAAPPPWAPPAALWAGAALLALVWLSTALVQVPGHDRLRAGWDEAAHRRLVAGNWARTALWSARALLVLALAARALTDAGC